VKLRGIDFGHVLDASGARSWFGGGHLFHPFIPGLSFEGSTFVAKTTTLHANRGNANMRRDGLTPRVFPQRSVKVNLREAAVLNAFGLSGPGLRVLLDHGRWQAMTRPFFLSFMAIAQTPEARLDEVRGFVRMLKPELRNFAAPVGLQVNFSCPNVHANKYIEDFAAHLAEYQALGIPIMVKLSAAQDVDLALQIAGFDGCDALCVSNSIPWGALPDRIDWRGLFGSRSPLEQFGGGGLSGAPILAVVVDWVKKAFARGLRKPLNAGGGITKPEDVDLLVNAGARSIFVGSIAIVRGWRLQKTIQRANRLLAETPVSGQLSAAS
jgi:dihydroorotate dehydrogenase